MNCDAYDESIVRLCNSKFGQVIDGPPHINFDNLEAEELSSESEAEIDSDQRFNLVAINPITKEEMIICQSNNVSTLHGKKLAYLPWADELIIRDETKVCNSGECRLDRVMQNIQTRSNKYIRLAHIYKYVNIAIVLLVIALQASQIFYTFYDNKLANMILIIATFVVLAAYWKFGIGTLGVRYREYATMLHIYYRQGDEAKRTLVKDSDYYQFADALQRDMDAISFDVFKMNYGPNEIDLSNTNGTNLSSSRKVDGDRSTVTINIDSPTDD